ncbi:rho GTPase-activating protein 44-like isoform X8 [Haliotis cracherodii]|uniref:rho GTPase-activating protein 44-like isoform X8 n=1 Tax=Haliotis cracherodii TaxID=6455 RepID=UPI0039EB957B
MWKKENLRKNFLRVKQIADQNLGRVSFRGVSLGNKVEKSEVLSEEFQSVEKRVENVKTVSSTIGKKLSSTLKAQQGDVEKRLKKLPETSLGYSLIEAAGILGTETLLGLVCQICGECQSKLAREQLQYEINVEREVLTPLLGVQEADIPAINKVRKQLTKSTLDMDSAKNRLNAAVRQSHVPGTNISSAAAKADTIKDEYEDAMNKVEQVKDCLAIELSNFVAKETDHSTRLLELLQSQAEYHKKALEYIEEVIPRMKTSIDNYPNKPVYGTSLVEHLRVTGRDIALVFEACIVTLLETGMEEEGLFRIAGAAIKLKKLKAVFDAHLIDMEEFVTEPHVIAGALKQYMRELPEPLLTYSLYTDFMQAATLPHDQRLQALWTVVSKMPKPNYDNFRYLVKFLAKLAEKSDVNKMTPSNIAIVIGPNLLWSEGESAPNMLTTGTLSSIIEAFVMHADYFFPGELDFTNTGGLPLQATSPQQRFGNAVAPSAGPPSPGGQGETIQLLPSPTTAPQGSSLLGGSSPQGGGNGSNASSTSSLTATSAESPELGSSPKVQRRVSRKPAPPPPYAVAVTATYNNRNSQSQTQSQTWPRNAPLASPESPSESDKEDNERVRPCPPEKPPPPHQLHPHPERPTGPPPDRPAGPPPERPKAPPPVVPPGHQRSASTGAMFTVVGMPGAANGQGTGTLFSSQESLEKDSGSTLTEQGTTPLLSPSSDKHATSNSHIKSGSSQNMRVTRPTPPPPPPPINKATEETHL